VAHHHNVVRGVVHLPVSTIEALKLIKWGVRSLYLLLFLSLMVAMGRWHVPITFTFLGSVFALILPVLFFLEGEREDIFEDVT
jgi:hypothetical protein